MGKTLSGFNLFGRKNSLAVIEKLSLSLDGHASSVTQLSCFSIYLQKSRKNQQSEIQGP